MGTAAQEREGRHVEEAQAGKPGGFNWSLQHLTGEVCTWLFDDSGVQIERSAESYGPPDGRQRPDASSADSSGSRLRPGARPKMPPSASAWR